MEREILERPSELDEFKAEIRAWIESEMQKKGKWQEHGETGEAYDPHADFIKPELLNETDMIIWRKVKDGNVTNEDMIEYSQKFDGETAGEAPDIVQAREEFKAMILNQAIPILVIKSKAK